MDVIATLYEVLQVEETAEEREVKKAYVRMLRKYPPEKSPEEFKKIREAYERLIDPISRAEYDALSRYADEIKEHDRLGREAVEKKDFKTAIREYKKILIIEPKLTFARNRLGLALMYDKQYDEALVQFRKLVKMNSKNAAFYDNLAYVYKKKLRYDRAEQAWLKAYKLNPIDDNIILELTKLYIDQEEYKKAVEFLRKCIERNKDGGIQNFIYYFEMVKVYVFSNDTVNLEKVIDEIEAITPDEKEVREYVAWKFGELAYKLLQDKGFSVSQQIAKRAMQIDSDNEKIKKLYRNLEEINKAIDLYWVLEKDKRVPSVLKETIYNYLYKHKYKEEEFKENIEKNKVDVQQYVDLEFAKAIRAIEILRNEYYQLYRYKKDFYDAAYHTAQINELQNDQLEILVSDIMIAKSIKKLIELWVSKQISEEEKDLSYKITIKEVYRENSNDIIASINRIKTKYPDLYELNPDILEEIRALTMKSNYSNVSKTSTDTEITYEEPLVGKKSLKQRLFAYLLILISAMIGWVVLPPVGFFIGALIGFLISGRDLK